MLNWQEHISIDKNVSSKDDLDFDHLKKLGIEYIESMGSKLWTDYNLHDPGITILEMLCYAISDLGLRMELPMQDLLADEENSFASQFHDAESILSCKPVTPLDYRKIFMDIPGVRNAWLTKHEKKVFVNCKDDLLSYDSFENYEDHKELLPSQKKEFTLNGLYDLIVDLEDDYTLEDIEPTIRARYHENRNLCEDLINITEVQPQPVKICAEIDLEPEADEDLVMAQILQVIDDYFSPDAKWKTLKQLLDKGLTPDEIFNGPVLENGFLDNEELRETQLRTQIRQSDIINLLMDIDGIKVIKDISLGNCVDNETPLWLLCIDKGKKPILCDKSSWSFTKGFIPLNINKKRVAAILEDLKKENEVDLASIKNANRNLDLPKGSYKQVGETTTIQNDFPEVYNIGRYGIKSTATEAEKANAKQLKAYLLFFDQILANYFAHLDHVRTMLSVAGETEKTFSAQTVKDIKNGEDILPGITTMSDESLATMFYPDFEQRDILQRNKILDHLMARFAENFGNYAFLMKNIYGSFADKAIIETKTNFIKNYASTSYERAKSFNYFGLKPKDLWDTPNVSALQKRLYHLLGITDINRRNLSEDYVEIYEEKDDDDKLEYRWRIKDGNKTILSSATKSYQDLDALYRELALVKQHALDLKNYEFKRVKSKTESSKFRWYFVLTNPEVTDKKSEDYIIARRIATYASKSTAQKAGLEVLQFVKTLIGNEGMYVIEHILLRPDVTKDVVSFDQFLPICTENCESCEPVDPYSFRVSIVLPGWTERFGNIDFRRFVENLIRKELPAHIMAKICWIGYPKNYTKENGQPPEKNQMVILEEAYKDWLISKSNAGQSQDEQKLKKLNKTISTLHTIYHQGFLHRCRPEDSDAPENISEKQKIILGRTNLGKL